MRALIKNPGNFFIVKPPFWVGIYGGLKEMQANSTSNKTTLFYCLTRGGETKALKLYIGEYQGEQFFQFLHRR